jgi:hypothetical protein
MNIPVEVYVAMQEITTYLSMTDDLTTRLRVAMDKARDHWMATSDDHQFRAAVGAVLISYPPESEEFKRIQFEMNQLQQMSTMIQAAQLGMSFDGFDISEDTPKPIGLIGMWRSEPSQ